MKQLMTNRRAIGASAIAVALAVAPATAIAGDEMYRLKPYGSKQADPGQQLYCAQVETPGSRLKHSICRTRASWAAAGAVTVRREIVERAGAKPPRS